MLWYLNPIYLCMLLVMLSCLGPTVSADESKTDLRTVRIIFLVSRDREENVESTAAFQYAIRDLQKCMRGNSKVRRFVCVIQLLRLCRAIGRLIDSMQTLTAATKTTGDSTTRLMKLEI